VIERVKAVIADSLIAVVPTDSARTDPSPVSSVDSPAFRLIASTIRGMVPGQSVPVLPYLVGGGTDAKYWGPHSANVYRFLAVPLEQGDVTRIHGVDERMSVKGYGTAVLFYASLLQRLQDLK
jgi:carboxypeptidase PM20D1